MQHISEILQEEFLIAKLNAGETVVLNLRKHINAINYAISRKKAIYCDRRKGSKYGNPHVMKSENERLKVVRAFWNDIKHGRTKLKEQDFRVLKGKALVCWCYPKKCHCEALKFVSDKLAAGYSFDEIKRM
jgi:hypothetical protein